jgi:protein gp37
MGNPRYLNGFNLTLHDDLISAPLRWKKSRLIFVNSMSDLFHKDVPYEFINQVFEVMRDAHWHVFQIVTKRSERLAELAPKLDWPSNVWMGVTVESNKHYQRIHDLAGVPATVRFLSVEPLLSSMQRMPLKNIDWVIVGGESGPFSRPMQGEWVRGIRSQCLAKNVPFFFKQWGGTRKKEAGRTLDGRIWSEMPTLV